MDFSKADDFLQKPTGRWRDEDPVPLSPEGFRLNKQQIYRRRKRARDAYLKKMESFGRAEAAVMYRKPLEEWDAEELARGRPRDKNGTFRGAKPLWVSNEIHEEAMDRFKSIVKTGMRVATVDALSLVRSLVNDDSVDNRGRPLVPASTKLQAAQFLIEHVVGKPTQRIESDVNIKLQAMLANVMVNPNEGEGYAPAHLPGITMELSALAEDDEGDDEEYVPE